MDQNTDIARQRLHLPHFALLLLAPALQASTLHHEY
jgi:hypothetical protein